MNPHCIYTCVCFCCCLRPFFVYIGLVWVCLGSESTLWLHLLVVTAMDWLYSQISVCVWVCVNVCVCVEVGGWERENVRGKHTQIDRKRQKKTKGRARQRWRAQRACKAAHCLPAIVSSQGPTRGSAGLRLLDISPPPRWPTPPTAALRFHGDGEYACRWLRPLPKGFHGGNDTTEPQSLSLKRVTWRVCMCGFTRATL